MGQAWLRGPTNYRNFNDGEKSDHQCSKVTRKLSESKNLGVWGRSPQPPEANGDLGAEPPTLWRFFLFFFAKIKQFYAYFGLNFCLKMCFRMTVVKGATRVGGEG